MSNPDPNQEVKLAFDIWHFRNKIGVELFKVIGFPHQSTFVRSVIYRLIVVPREKINLLKVGELVIFETPGMVIDD